jgi:hypothetical protein
MDTRRVVRVVIALCVLALVGWAIALALVTADQNSRQTKLQQHGIPVEVTVTGSVGQASGSGSTVDGYTTRGTYRLDGHLFNEVIEGTSAVHPVGQKLAAVAVRGDPALVSTAEGVPKRRSSWTAYTTPIVLGALAIALALGLVLWPAPPRRMGAPRS